MISKRRGIALYSSKTALLVFLLFTGLSFAFSQEINCGDGIDNDGDGLIDCFDTDCGGTPACADFYYGVPIPDCQFIPPANADTFEIELVWQTDDVSYPIDQRHTPLVGDVDNDGDPEVLGKFAGTPGYIRIFSGIDGSHEISITITDGIHSYSNMAMADIDEDGTAEIFVVNNAKNLVRAEHNGAITWTSASTVPASHNSPNIANFDGSGEPEIYIGNQIFRASDGVLLVNGVDGLGGGSEGGYVNTESFPVPVDIFSSTDIIPATGSPCGSPCDGLELVAGDTCYAVDLTSISGLTAVSWASGLGDGVTSVADMDNDGDPDAVIMVSGKISMWDIRSGSQLFTTYTMTGSTTSGGRINLADFDNDGYMEIGAAGKNVYAVLDTNISGTLVAKWTYVTDDGSERTGSTVYDFEGDGANEVVYSDEEYLYVYDGATGDELVKIVSQSGTRFDYPLVVDVNDDGQSEIVLTSQIGNGPGFSGNNFIRAYRSKFQPWVPARPVWNQHTFLCTNINDDLTVPVHQQNHWIVPKLNGFLVQSPTRLVNGEPAFQAPDVQPHILGSDNSKCGNDSLGIIVRIGNTGDGKFPAGATVAFYLGNPRVSGSIFLDTAMTTVTVDEGNYENMTFYIPFTSGDFPGDLFVVLNDTGFATAQLPLDLSLDFPVTYIGECDYTNNITNAYINAGCAIEPDRDQDGVVDFLDLDSDNDGIPDTQEDGDTGFDATGDEDADGIPNYMDNDDITASFPAWNDNNGDGVNDVYDRDSDGIPDAFDLDSDNDGIPDLIEAGGSDAEGNGLVDCFAITTDPASLTDTDTDGWCDTYDNAGGAFTSGTPMPYPDTDNDGLEDYADLDSDDDGIPDLIEAGGFDADGDGQPDNDLDQDRDGLADVFDSDDDGVFGTDAGGGTDPLILAIDSGSDGLADSYTDGEGNDADADNDGIINHLDLDADNDGMPDIIEAGGVDSDGDGRVDAAVSTDTDGDGLADVYDSDASDGPSGSGTDGSALAQTTGFDTDANGKADDAGIGYSHGNGRDTDPDGDGIPGFLDLDTDGDGITDIIEAGGIDNNGDGHLDTPTDVDADGLADIYDTDANDGPGGTGSNGTALVQTNGTDTDTDGLADQDASVGYQHGGAITDIDTDGDNIPNWIDLDSDNDGVPDVIEVGAVDATGDGLADITTDADGDGLADAWDSNASDGPAGTGTNGVALIKTTGTDTGNDGLADGDGAIAYARGDNGMWPDWDSDGIPNYIDLDTDNDGIADITESGGTDANHDGIVDGAFADTDGDGYSDTFDADDGGTAITTTGADINADNFPDSYSDDADSDVHPSFADVDADDDGILDNMEAQTTSGYTVSGITDTDGDGILDEYDGGNFLIPENTDGSGYADYLDTDSDGDGIPDADEAWDGYDDGDVSSDLSCSADADDDGLLDCYDNNSVESTDQTVGTTPPTDNGFDGTGYTDSKTSTGSTPEDIFPNNGGAANQPDWRDGDGCSLSPVLVYPVTGTHYLFSAGEHVFSGATTGTIRSTNFCVDAVSAGYTYYYPAIEPDKVLFSIAHGSNTTRVDYVELRREEALNRIVTSGSQGHFVMGRDWFVRTLDDAGLTANVNVRFYFDPADSVAMADSASSFATASGGTIQPAKWFKVDDTWNNGDITAADGLSARPGYTELSPAAYGTEGGLHYVQFNSISGFSGGGLQVEVSGTLPVEMLDFHAVRQDNDAYIGWMTASEENTDKFIVERSVDSRNFIAVGEVPASGKSSTRQFYSFLDKNVPANHSRKVYYRLRIVDLGGAYTFSNIREIQWVSHSDAFLQVYPNPGSKDIQIRFLTNDSRYLSLFVFDLQGREIWQKDFENTYGEKLISLDVTHWPSGMYQFILRSDEIELQQRFMKE
ncbi:MAG: FG-GAP-like repeat-containing protein [Bacteroidia bacterium]